MQLVAYTPPWFLKQYTSHKQRGDQSKESRYVPELYLGPSLRESWSPWHGGCDQRLEDDCES